ncbi:MAG: hypothetical protein CM1200mP40_14350 [Gammaproteobacteria bacterium]|nr:MAG: hypothetical protein CM1200mP40_14350 [Gammaproteobacteria bacterium]
MKFIHGAIANGAMAFLKQEYKFLTIFMVVFAAIIMILIDDSHTPDTREGIYTLSHSSLVGLSPSLPVISV